MHRKQFFLTLFSPILAAFGYKRKPKFIQLTPIRVKSALTFDEFIGILNPRIKVYKDPYYNTSKVQERMNLTFNKE